MEGRKILERAANCPLPRSLILAPLRSASVGLRLSDYVPLNYVFRYSRSENRKLICIFAHLFVPLHPQNGKVPYGMLPWNPPGLDRSKGTRL